MNNFYLRMWPFLSGTMLILGLLLLTSCSLLDEPRSTGDTTPIGGVASITIDIMPPIDAVCSDNVAVSMGAADCDGDGVENASDAFPRDACVSIDSDGDGIADVAHGMTAMCTDPAAVVTDAFPNNACATTNSDGDALPDTIFVPDAAGSPSACSVNEAMTLAMNLSASAISEQIPNCDATDLSTLSMCADPDDDNDGTHDFATDGITQLDSFPLNACATLDDDGDGVPIVLDPADSTNECDEDTALALIASLSIPGCTSIDTLDRCSDAFDADSCISFDGDNDGIADAVHSMIDVLACTNAALVLVDEFPADPARSCTITAANRVSETIDCDNDGSNNSVDIDRNNNGLIDIYFLEELDYMRHDLAGHSYKPGATAPASTIGAPTASRAGMVCNEETSVGSGIWLCGYELIRSLDFAVADSYAAGTIDTLWCPQSGGDAPTTGGSSCRINGHGFAPIGDRDTSFNAIFYGNRNEIANLYISTGAGYAGGTGLFGGVELGNEIRQLGLIQVTVQSMTDEVGALVGANSGIIAASYATGSVSGPNEVGGMVGVNSHRHDSDKGTIVASYANVNVSGITIVGGLSGINAESIIASYARGSVDASLGIVGGLVGNATEVVSASWSSGSVNGNGRIAGGLFGVAPDGYITISAGYWDTTSSGLATSDGVGTVGLTTEQMQAADGANFGGSNTAGRFGGCGIAYSFRGTEDSARYPQLRLFLGTTDGDVPAADCSNHLYHTTEVLARQ